MRAVTLNPRRAAHGFTLVELMVTVAIALFLIGGLLTILQNVRSAQNNQQLLSQLQDQQRFALSVLTDVIQSGGYYPDPLGMTVGSALPAAGAFQAGQPFSGTTAAGLDTISVRYVTASGDSVLLCDGSTNGSGANQVYTNVFSIVGGQLVCTLNGNATAIVGGVTGLTVYYGVKRNAAIADYNADTYLTAGQMLVAGPNGNDWSNVSSVRIVVSFANPLFGQPGQVQQNIQLERVIEVMARAGVHT
ncbi:MAG TPA: PilW family protein [Candidatus Dormibacteraeota bacterium]|nr:PilW family protein [Candidatus Dormibacteraeota bacterium]